MNNNKPVLVISEFLEEVLELPLQHFHVFQVHSHVFGSDIGLLVVDPVQNFITLTNVVKKFQSLLQFDALVAKFEEQLVP